jgi:hypothetical protein
MVPRADVAALRRGRTVLAEDEMVTCRSCGSAIASAKAMSRIEDLVGDQPGLVDHVSRHCVTCRGSKSGPPRSTPAAAGASPMS